MALIEGRLSPCPRTPNCVSSQEHGRSHIAPLVFNDAAPAAFVRLKRIVAAFPRARIVAETGDYLHAEFTSRILRFVDDIEFIVDGCAHCVHVRSASRVGYSDFGVNRARVEAIRKKFTAQGE